MEIFLDKLDEQEQEEKLMNEMIFSERNFKKFIHKLKDFRVKMIPYLVSENLQISLALINFIFLIIFLYEKKDQY